MRCKVPAASGLRATHAPPRRPEVTPAAHADRMLQTPPDIATRSQSAGRSVNRPEALRRRPPGGHWPSWSTASVLPPEHPWGLAASIQRESASAAGTRPVGGCPPNPGLGIRGQLWAFCPPDWGSACLSLLSFLGSSLLFSEVDAGGPSSRYKQMPKCPCQPLPTPPSRGPPSIPGISQGGPGPHALGSPGV